MQKNIKKYFWLFVLPTLIAFCIAFVIPFIMGIYLSFTKFTTVANAQFVRFENYIKAFSNDSFINSLFFTTKFTIVSVITINLIAFTFAYMLTRKLKGTNIFRTVFFMPNLIGGIVLGYIWQLILNGILNQFGVTLTYKPEYGFWGLVILLNWQQIGYMMIIYIAGIQNIPGELIESAQIDGASKMGILKNITIPLVMPSVTICLFLTVSNAFKLFDQNLALTDGAPGGQTAMVALDIYKTFYGRVGSEGVGQAKAVIFFVIVAVIMLVQLKITRNKEVEN
ncbi:sugar ABC transporter permease [Clostridium sp. Ade.TY]|uniref:carbohydrate ABC transporter permease n=1 Tax=Clostridium sp. Ade.TY TaxID=1391647 RepID=UPI0004099758|nr:sugar ABC transporter permease [Clostridium sp. Ade.TY]